MAPRRLPVHCSDILGAHDAGWGARLAGAKLISNVRNSHSTISRRDQTFFYPVQEFVFVSQGVKQALDMPERMKKGSVLYDVPGEHKEIVVNAAEARLRFGVREGGPVVGMAARLAPQKDFPTLVRAAKLIGQAIPNVQFLIAGDTKGSELSRQYFSDL
jgi:glycosyltransferase involved in cell wall biosynthesis